MKADYKDLLARKLARDNSKNVTKDVYVTSMDREMTFKKPSDDLVLEIMDEIGDDATNSQTANAFKKLIYLTCPLLQNTELHAELEINDPYDTVDAIFSLSDVMEIGTQLMDLIDLGVQKVKNS